MRVRCIALASSTTGELLEQSPRLTVGRTHDVLAIPAAREAFDKARAAIISAGH